MLRAMLGALVVSLSPAVATGEGVFRHVLPNGVRVLVRESRGADVVAVSLQVRAGSRHESAETAGLTNLLVRTMLRGTADLPGSAFAEAAEAIGGTIDGGAEAEHAEVRGRALGQHWERLLELLADAVLAPALVAAEVEKERRVVLAQIDARADTPFSAALDRLIANLYGAHGGAHPAVGVRTAVERFTREDLLAHHRRIFTADRMVVAVSGNVPGARVVKRVERLFARATTTAAPAPLLPVPPPPDGGRQVVAKPAQQAQVMVGFLVPGLDEPGYAAVRVLYAVLGGGMSARLFTKLREERALAYSVGVVSPWRSGPGFLAAYLATSPDNATEAEAELLAELERLRTEEVGEMELARAKAFVLGQLAMDRRTNAREAWYLAFHEGAGLGWDFPRRYARAVERVTIADVGAAARRLATPSITVLEPLR